MVDTSDLRSQSGPGLYESLERLLDTYSLEELLQRNELSEAEVLLFLVHKGLVQLPDPLPVDVSNYVS